MRRTRGTETSKYPEEKKSIEIPLVAASERGVAERYELVEQPINVVVFYGPTGLSRSQGKLILKEASRLDAFSAYPVRT